MERIHDCPLCKKGGMNITLKANDFGNLECDVCGNSWALKDENLEFCWKWDVMKKICKNCGAEYEDSAGEFCSRDCSAKFYDKIQKRVSETS